MSLHIEVTFPKPKLPKNRSQSNAVQVALSKYKGTNITCSLRYTERKVTLEADFGAGVKPANAVEALSTEIAILAQLCHWEKREGSQLPTVPLTFTIQETLP